MQRKENPLLKLLNFDLEYRKQYIASLDEKEVNNCIHLIEKELQSKNHIFIDLDPKKLHGSMSGYISGRSFNQYISGNVTFPQYHGEISVLHDRVYEDLLIDFRERKEQIEMEWRRNLNLRLSPDAKSNEQKILELENTKLKENLRESLNKMQILVDEKEKHTRTYEKIKINQDEVLRQTIEENNLLKKENMALRQILDGKHDKQGHIATKKIEEIVEKYEKKKYNFFSHTPGILRNLKQLFGPETVSKAEVRACLNDPNNIFDATPSFNARGDLTNRGNLICELSDAFNQQVGVEDLECKEQKLR